MTRRWKSTSNILGSYWLARRLIYYWLGQLRLLNMSWKQWPFKLFPCLSSNVNFFIAFLMKNKLIVVTDSLPIVSQVFAINVNLRSLLNNIILVYFLHLKTRSFGIALLSLTTVKVGWTPCISVILSTTHLYRKAMSYDWLCNVHAVLLNIAVPKQVFHIFQKLLIILVFILECSPCCLDLLQFIQFLFKVIDYLLKLSNLGAVSQLYMLLLNSLLILLDLYFLACHRLKIVVPLDKFLRRVKLKHKVSLMSRKNQASKVLWLLYHYKASLKRNDIDNVTKLWVSISFNN